MINKLCVTVLIDELSSNNKLTTERGLSLFIETDQIKLLMDTGLKGGFIKNAEILGLDLSAINAIVLSHGHLDHAGGIPDLANKTTGIPLYVGPDIFRERFSNSHTEKVKNISLPENTAAIIREKFKLITVTEPLELSEGIILSGKIEHYAGNPLHNYGLWRDNAHTIPDAVKDEIFLAVKTEKGIVVISACTHAGVENIIANTKRLFPNEKLFMFLGGLHLRYSEPFRIQNIAYEMKSAGFEHVYPMHCTGQNGVQELQRHIPSICYDYSYAGQTINII